MNSSAAAGVLYNEDVSDMGDIGEVDILLVEDNLNDVELTIRALRKNKFTNKIFHVRDGEEAVDFLFAKGAYAYRKNERPPRIIFLDLKLPKVDGLDVLRQIKSNPRTKTVPVVALTSSQEEKDIAESYKLGVNSYIVKPVEFEKFSKAIAEVGIYWLILNKPLP